MKAMFVRSVVVVAGLQVAAMAQAVWTQVHPFGRQYHAMAYDSARQRICLFHGASLGSSETWEWDGSGWMLQTPSLSPPPRFAHSMVYDSTRQISVLFGGQTSSGVDNATWEWNGATWVQRSPATTPPARQQYAMAYDRARQRAVLFGGIPNSAVTFADTWEWDGSSWVQRSPVNSPSARYRHSMAYDGVRQRVVLFGGILANDVLLADTWEWDGNNWVAAFTTVVPPARAAHSAAYDEVSQCVLIFGGRGNAGILGDTWGFDGSAWTQASPIASPPPSLWNAMAYDGARQRVVLVGPGTWINAPATSLASATPYGTGCGQPPLGFAPDAAGRPVLGQTASATIVDAPTSATFVAMGSSNQTFGPFPLPVTLASIGMSGCDLYQSAEVLGLATSPASPTTRSFSLAIPNTQTLIGLHIYMQAYAFAPGANPLNVIISNAIDWRLGDV